VGTLATNQRIDGAGTIAKKQTRLRKEVYIRDVYFDMLGDKYYNNRSASLVKYPMSLS